MFLFLSTCSPLPAGLEPLIRQDLTTDLRPAVPARILTLIQLLIQKACSQESADVGLSSQPTCLSSAPGLRRDILLFLLSSTCSPLPAGRGVINNTLQSNRKSKGQSELIFRNRIICDLDRIANHFNDYVINISRTLSEQIQLVHLFDHYLNGNVTSKF